MNRERFNKLPKWVKEEFRKLENKNKELERLLSRAKIERDESIFIRNFEGIECPISIPKGEPIYKRTTYGAVFRIDLSKSEEISIIGEYGGNSELCIVPAVSNHIKIKVK